MAVAEGMLVAYFAVGLDIHATLASAALDAMMSKPRHLVISDYHMPNMDGLELLKSLRGFKPTSKCGFILITGQADAHTIAQGKVLGMNNVLKKPFTVDGLKSCIQSIVGKL